MSIVEDTGRHLSELPIMLSRHDLWLIRQMNDTKVDFPGMSCIHQLFEDQVARTPSATAVVFHEDSLSYEELNRRANMLAHYLRELGVKPDMRVAICAERSFEMVIALLAVIKAGGAYVPLDPAYPADRLRFMLEDCAPVALLTQGHLRSIFAGISDGRPVLDLAAATPPWLSMPETNLDRNAIGLTSQHLAYIIYTSGSTGMPKGVMVEHKGLVNRIIWMQRAYNLTCDDAVLQKTPFSFDVSVWEFFWPLITGARLVMARPEGHKDADYLCEAIHRNRITTLHFVPSMLQAFVEQADQVECSSLKRVVCSGEALPGALVRRFRERLPRVALHNLYGPTEATVDVTAWTCPSGVPQQSNPPIGRPIANTQIYILDDSREPVAIGAVGELYIGGVQVARGYLNRAELTAERFLPDPFTSSQGGRMYRTGDLARWLEDGNIEYLGRNDFQVKIRGFRIELGEIEARLAEHPGVREAVVIAREDTPGDQRLVAYYTLAGTGDSELEPLSVESLRAHLSEKLPDYMVPAAYVRLEFLPRTPNGKLDRKALPAPDGDAYAVRGYESPRGEIEIRLAQIWADLLKLGKIGRYDNFFELGGHSLLAVRVVTRLQQALRLEVAMRDLFAHPVLADLARSLETAAHSVLPLIAHCERGKKVPLSFAQQRLWFLAQMGGVGHAYHISTGLHLRGELNHAALRCALDRIVARHEALRTPFPFIDGEPVQQIADGGKSRFRLIEHDLRQHRERQAELDRITGIDGGTCFDLETGPLIRGRLLRLAEDEHALLITPHHNVSDAWSMGLLVNELSALYGAFLQGKDDPLPELEIQYADYAVWQRKWIEGEILQRQAAYWKTNLTEAPALLEGPGDHPHPPGQDYAGGFSELL